MTTVKKLNGNYVIQTPFKNSVVGSSNITLDTDTVYITGNLWVRGNTSEIASNTLSITDNIITLNDGETGNGVTALGSTSGIVIDRGTAPGGNVQLRWNETATQWQVSGMKPGYPGDGTQFLSLAASSTGLTALIDDPNPVLGANLCVNGKTIYANVNATSYVTVQGAFNMKYANVTYTPALGGIVFNAAEEGAGQTGLYVTGDASTNEELVTKRRAFGFSLFL